MNGIGSIKRIRVIDPPVRRQRFTRVGDIPANIRPTSPGPLKLKNIEPDDGIITTRKGLYYATDKYAELEKRAVSKDIVYGSVQERILYRDLKKRNIAFDFQSSLLGARPGGSALGGLVADFVLVDMDMVIQVQGGIWHTGREAELRDIVQADELNYRGFDVVFLWDTVIENEDKFRLWMNQNTRYRLPRKRRADLGIRNFGGIRVERPRS